MSYSGPYSSLSNRRDIVQRRNTIVGQTNKVVCFFNKLNTVIKLELLKSYCSTMYGTEHWALNSAYIESCCVAWRKALRHIVQLPCNSHSYFLPILSDTLPVYDEICKRSMRFIASSQPIKSINQICIYKAHNFRKTTQRRWVWLWMGVQSDTKQARFEL